MSWNVCTATDVLPPELTCPRDLDVTVAEWGDNSTIVHYDVQKPQISDNSGQFEYSVDGVPSQLRFPLGVTQLKYEAFDAAGNVASCTQQVHVRGLSLSLCSTLSTPSLALRSVIYRNISAAARE